MSIKIDNFKQTHPARSDDLDMQLREASRLYEKQFMGEMVKAMRSTISHTNEPSMAEKIYSDKVYEQYVDQWSDQGGVGLSDIIYGQLRERFYPEKAALPRPEGPVPLNKGTQIKIDETKNLGIPLEQGGAKETPDISYLFKFEPSTGKSVTNPWAGEIADIVVNDDRQTVNIAHPDGLRSKVSFRGSLTELARGQKLDAGQKLGTLAPDASGLTWKVALSKT